MTTLFVQSPTLYLAGSGVIIGATSITLTSLTDIYGNVLTMADFGSVGYITLEPDTTNAEAATFTGVTANANGTYTLTGVKTGLAKSPYTETSGLVRNHAGGTKVVVTDNVEFWNTFVNKNNDGTMVGYLSGPTPVSSGQYATKGYVDGVAIAGAPTASTTVLGIAKLSVDPAIATSPIVVETTDGRVPTQSENDALAGTSGTPSSSNKYVTNDDVSSTGGSGKIVRLSGTSYPAGGGTAITGVIISPAVGASASRTSGTNYQNTTGKALLVSYAVSLTGGYGSGSYGQAIAYCDSTSTPTVIVGKAKNSNNQTNGNTETVTNIHQIVIIVPPSFYYRIDVSNSGTGSGASIDSTMEQALAS